VELLDLWEVSVIGTGFEGSSGGYVQCYVALEDEWSAYELCCAGELYCSASFAGAVVDGFLDGCCIEGLAVAFGTVILGRADRLRCTDVRPYYSRNYQTCNS